MPVTLTSLGGLSFAVEDGLGHSIRLDDSNAAEAEHTGFSPMRALLAALGGCTAIDVLGILRRMRQEVDAYRVEVDGERRDEHPRVFTSITLLHTFRGRVSEDNARRAISLSMTRYCPVGATVRATVPITCRYRIDDGDGGSLKGEIAFAPTHARLPDC
ncbi:MAG: osmotically inducible protein OsmC [Dehalococcoidia bacterium]|nr:osmotically inducible protein OsmC [Dehalococcoidia bacterium]